MKRLWLLIAGLFLGISAYTQPPDSIAMPMVILADISIVDFKNDNQGIFKSVDLNVNSKTNKVGGDLGDLIQNTAPIYFKNYSVGGIKTIDLRGTGSERTKVYWNGIPINSPTLGSFDFSMLPFYFVEDARLRFGGASLTDGGGGLGGSVQLVNSASFDEHSLEVAGSYGSFDSYTIAAKGLVSLNKFKSDSRIFFLKAKNDYSYINKFKQGHPTENRLNNEVRQLGFQQIFSYLLNEKNSLSARFSMTDSDRNIPPPISSTGVGAKQKDYLLISQLAWNWVPIKNAFLNIRTGFQNQENRYIQEDFIDANTAVNAWNNNIDVGYEGIESVILSASLRFDRYWVISDGAGQVNEDHFTGLINADWQVINQLKLVLGARIITITNNTSPFMPYGGIAFQFPKYGGSIRANVSRVYRFPTINERYWNPGGNPDLLPEQGWNYELGYQINRNFQSSDFEFGLNTFYGLINHWILWQPNSLNPFFWEAQNIWKVINKGMEFNMSTNLKFSETTRLSLAFNYTYTSSTVAETKQSDDIVGKQLILVPKHQFLIPIELFWKNFTAALNYHFVSKRYTDRLNKHALSAYNLIDVVLGYGFINKSIQTNFRINNLINQQYQTIPGQPLAGINFNLEINFKIF